MRPSSDSRIPSRSRPPLGLSQHGKLCEARQRLPEGLIWKQARRTGRDVHDRSEKLWLFHDRSVKIVDGSTVVMPDTRENPIIFSLAVGTVLDAAVGPYREKQTSELA